MLSDSEFDADTLETDVANVALSDDPQQRADQIANLRRYVKNGQGNWQLLAIRALAADQQLDNVPYFILGLQSTDRQIVLAARDALMRLRRSFNAVGPPDQFTRQQQLDAIRSWKDWYQTVQPNAQFLK
jgi:hypothetical protein